MIEGRAVCSRRLCISLCETCSRWCGCWDGREQARNLVMELGNEHPFRFLIHDRDTKFSHAFGEVFRSEAIKMIRTPVQAPNANAHAERWVRTVRADCLDRILIF